MNNERIPSAAAPVAKAGEVQLPPLPQGQLMGSGVINGKRFEMRMHDDEAMRAYALVALASTPQAAPTSDAEATVRHLLWDDHPECCGQPVVGAQYMGSTELVCCGNVEPGLLSDAQIVAKLRNMFPDAQDRESGNAA